ncbi:DUF368 domain-containing protein [Algibacillus agarilyticus]|uniref:DUF368 domain-containing protein n=1 Tax=Algibacillus agarilyticus TaxID=2234133 RepID=UPI000DD0899A|nr:DUF368 domain-containing protein [Algibacillus agarilyticus]
MKQRNIKDYALLTTKGLAMGAADVVPGVSGGTVAFVTGIYDELLGSLKKLGPSIIPMLFKQGIKATWQHINGNFLLAVFGGILLSLKTFASLISFALAHHPILVWAFFSGLIIASIRLLFNQQPKWQIKQYLSMLLGIIIVYFISVSTPAQLPSDGWFLFLGGFIAICAMILPGISGSFILLLMGLYPVFLDAIKSIDIIALASFGGGCICGLLVFSRFLSWLLAKYEQTTIAVLIGFLIGSLNVTWPWKQTVSTYINRHGDELPLIRANVNPNDFEMLTQVNPQLTLAVIVCLSGIALVIGLEFLATKFKQN